MTWTRALACGWILVATIAHAAALGIDGKAVKLETIELPVVSMDGLDYASVRAELAYADISLGEAEIRQMTSICVPKGSKNPLNLTGNRIETLPEEIGRLENLKVLTLKDNPLAPGEVDRLKELLPGCKIKV